MCKHDALPSWSGFNYQGKMTLLCVMIKLNQILEGEIVEPDSFWFELEKDEDFVIYQGALPIGLYQVKARLGDETPGKFGEACKKLIDNRTRLLQDLGDHTAICYLVSATNIRNWEKDANHYRDSVKLFKYSRDGEEPTAVGLQEVGACLEQEILKYISLVGYSHDRSDLLYLRLCAYLGNRVAAFHKEGKRSSYRIGFLEIMECLDAAVGLEKEYEKLVIRESVYKHVANVLETSFEEHCKTSEEEGCEGFCGVNTLYNGIKSLDLLEYIKNINPHKCNWEPMHEFTSSFTEEDFPGLILDIYSYVGPDKVRQIGNLFFFMNEEIIDLPLQHIVPTTITMASGNSRREARSVQKICQSVTQNANQFASLGGAILSGRINADIIPDIWKESIDYVELSSQEEAVKLEEATQVGVKLALAPIQALYESLERKGDSQDVQRPCQNY